MELQLHIAGMSASEFRTKESAITSKLGELAGVASDRVAVSLLPSASAALLLQTNRDPTSATLDALVTIRDGAGGVSSKAAAAGLLSMSSSDVSRALGVTVLSIREDASTSSTGASASPSASPITSASVATSPHMLVVKQTHPPSASSSASKIILGVFSAVILLAVVGTLAVFQMRRAQDNKEEKQARIRQASLLLSQHRDAQSRNLAVA